MRYYLDYNSTHPVLPEVLTSLSESLDIDANPSSQHSRGKASLKAVNRVSNFLKDFFQTDYNVIFHSGATEFMNTVFSKDNCEALVFSKCDHSAVRALAERLNEGQKQILELGHLPSSTEWLLKLQEFAQDKEKVWFNFQWMNNETGEVLSPDLVSKLKAHENLMVHIDAVQTVGKIETFQSLPAGADIVTYSGHKFGALKGIGFSFVRPGLDLNPYIIGGGQQGNLRSGTLNLHGILSLEAALKNRDFVEEGRELLELKQELIDIVAKNSKFRYLPNDSLNTLCLIHENLKSDAMLVHFDLANLEVSTGSACTSGSLKPSQTLLAMGEIDGASRNVRISLGPSNLKSKNEIISGISTLIEKL